MAQKLILIQMQLPPTFRLSTIYSMSTAPPRAPTLSSGVGHQQAAAVKWSVELDALQNCSQFNWNIRIIQRLKTTLVLGLSPAPAVVAIWEVNQHIKISLTQPFQRHRERSDNQDESGYGFVTVVQGRKCTKQGGGARFRWSDQTDKARD